MKNETLDFDKLSLHSNDDSETDFGQLTQVNIICKNINKINDLKHKSRSLTEYQSIKSGNDLEANIKRICLKRGRDMERASEEQLEKMARLMIEDSMSSAMIIRCWKCGQSVVKEGACTAVRCVCGATTCHSCGRGLLDNLLTAHQHCALATTPSQDRQRVRQAAESTKRALRADYPSLTFRDDPSQWLDP